MTLANRVSIVRARPLRGVIRFAREFRFPVDRQLPESRLQAMKELLAKFAESQAKEQER